MTSGAVLDPATDMRLACNRFAADPALPGVLRASMSPKAKCAKNWLAAETEGAGRIWIELPPQMGEP